MKRGISVLVLLLAAASSAFAQFTVVSGTVTDSNHIPYSGGQLTITLSLPTGSLGAYINGAQIAGTVGSITLDNTGSFLARLGDNTQIKCANAQGQLVTCAPQTQWSFGVTESPGVLPPLGTGPQTCAATLTISGTSQSVSGSFSACPVLTTGGAGGGSIPTATVSTLPSAGSSSGKTSWVSDGLGAGDCLIGGGASLVLCRSNGVVWQPEAAGNGSATVTAIRLSTQCAVSDANCFQVFQDGIVSLGSTWSANTSNGTTATLLTTNDGDSGAQFLQFNTAQTNVGGMFTSTNGGNASILAAFKIAGTLGAPASCSGTNDQAASATTVAVGPFTPANSGSGSILIAFTAAFAPDQTSITFADNNGNTWNNVLSRAFVNPTQASVQMAYVQNNNSGATTVTATFGASATFRSIFVCNFSGMASSNVLDSAVGGISPVGVATIFAGTLSTSGNDLLFQADRSNATSSTFTVGTLGVAANTISTNAALDPAYTSAAVGQKAVLTTGCGSANGFTSICNTPFTNPSASIVAVNGANNITVNSLLAISNTAPDAHGFTGWMATAHDDTTQYKAAFTKTLLQNGATLFMPCGLTILSGEPFDASGFNYTWNPVVSGCFGEAGTIIVPSLDFNYLGANGALIANFPHNNIRFATTPTVQTPSIYGKLANFTVWGLGLIMRTAVTLPIFLTSDTELSGVDCTAWVGPTTNNNFFLSGSATHVSGSHVWVCGGGGFNYTGDGGVSGESGAIYDSYLQAGGAGTNIIVNAGHLLSYNNSIYGGGTNCLTNSNNGVQVLGGVYTSLADRHNGVFVSGGSAEIDNAGVTSVGGCGAFVTVAGGTVSARNSLIDSFTLSSGTFNDLGGNFHTAPGTPFTAGTLSVTGGSSIGSASLTATPVTGNFTLTNATFTSVTGTDPKHFTLNITASAAAAITIVYTFPNRFLFAPGSCHATDVGGTNPLLTFSTSVTQTATAATFLSSAAATNTDTLQVAIDCQ